MWGRFQQGGGFRRHARLQKHLDHLWLCNGCRKLAFKNLLRIENDDAIGEVLR